jgi:hypothetical protein
LHFTFEANCTLSALGEFAFEYSVSLRSICIPSSIETISKSCFAHCSRLSTVAFQPGSKLSTLGESAFQDCRSLRSISIPASIETIYPSCFNGCPGLTTVVLEAGCKLPAQVVADLWPQCDVTWTGLQS